MDRTQRWDRALGASVAVLLATMIALAAMGRSPWCPKGDWLPWSWDIWSAHNSQHLLDPYTFSHVLHGVLFYGALRLLGERWADVRLVLAVALEAAWEIVENTDRVIEHYRETTISLDYFGDALLNSGADVVAMGLGYLVAARVPWWASVLIFVATEVALALWIRDSLLLNVVMLVCPIEAIKAWQMGG